MKLIKRVARRIYRKVKKEFPLNRVLPLVTPFLASIAAAVNVWLLDHAPIIAEQFDGDAEAQILAVLIGTFVLAYNGLSKWMDGHIQYERLEADPDMDVKPGDADDAFILSQPDDIAESDADHPDAPERRERIPERE